MKKFLVLIFLIVFIIVGYGFLNKNNKDKMLKLLKEVEEIEANISNYYVYGTHFNLEGTLNISDKNINEKNVSLVLKNENDEYQLEAYFEVNTDSISFKTSELINLGIDLDSLPSGDWYLFLKIMNGEEAEYYTLVNNTDYKNIEYYTITKNDKNNKIDIIFDKHEIDERKINYVSVNVKESRLPDDVYDITIDPGHGGNDPGANYVLNNVTYNEADITLEIALNLKKELEKKGFKVLITRDSDVGLDYYNEDGRATLPNKYHTKLSISLHLNSDSATMTYGGVEVYTPNDIDYTLARLISKNIVSEAGVSYSKKVADNIEKGVYYTYFTKQEIEESMENSINKDLKPYDIEVGAPEMYMIREVGGLMTHAYVDGRNDYYGINPYYNSNQAAEGYLVELAYISYESDLNKLITNSYGFVTGLKKAICEYIQ